jgi:hypothetical protein
MVRCQGALTTRPGHPAKVEPAVELFGREGRAGRRAAGILGKEPEAAGVGHGLGAVGRAELGEDLAGVLLDRLQGDHQLLGDVAVAPAGGQQPQYLQLPGGEGFDQRCDGRRG